MRLKQLDFRHVLIPLTHRIRHASHARSECDSVLVRAEFQDGTVGWGEGLPREYVTGESIDDTWQMITSHDWPQQLGGDWGTLPSGVERLAAWDLPRQISDERECFGNSLRCAIELSMLDGLCREAGKPVSSVTAILTGTDEIQAQRDHVHYTAPFTALGLKAELIRAAKLRYYGFQDVKVKVGVAGANDQWLLWRLRWLLGRERDLRIDANESWPFGEVERRINDLARFGISAVEQPVRHEDVQHLAAIRQRVGTPVVLDESLCSLRDAEIAIETKTCDLFNLRLSKCGGFLPLLKLAIMAHRADLKYQLGCQVGETGILSAAGRHFATSVGGVRYAEGSYDRFLLRELVTNEDLTFGRRGVGRALTAPGLGVTVNDSTLERITRRRTVVPIG